MPGPVLERLFVDFGAHFGSLLAPKWHKKAYKNRHAFLDGYRGVDAGDFGVALRNARGPWGGFRRGIRSDLGKILARALGKSQELGKNWKS